jgi:hypothetical protein
MAQTISNPAPVKVNASTYRVASRSSAGVVYTVIVLDDDSLSCNCAGGVFGKCWHMNSVRKMRDGRACVGRPKTAPDMALGLYLLTGGAQGSR